MLSASTYASQQPRPTPLVRSSAVLAEKVVVALVGSPIASQQASVSYREGLLTIRANDVDLLRLLQQLGGLDAMLIEGAPPATRVFGNFGPGVPQRILTELLEGLGCNVLIAGLGAGGLPRQLIFTERNQPRTIPAPSTPQVATAESKDAELLPLPEGVLDHLPPPPPIDPQERLQNTVQRLRSMRDRQILQGSQTAR